ncbi:hypothetical protein B0T17DRAFT_512094 [Bombardia bombarda]|uniref:Fungal N-terminal domain-containing protein n=1 Tax=Bombardia bombarda TaxID=252184 RepID=A0AA39U413_9PEZI|nr:hypothetical protein B0T17DRAFT_512094 [Bombardia bombarda]
MDPLTAVGAAASITQLLDLCVKSCRTARELWQSFTDAPAELQRVVEKLERMKFCIHQLHEISTRMAGSDVDDFFPRAHRATISISLQVQVKNLNSAWAIRQNQSGSFKTKLRWATIEKSKTSRVLKLCLEAEETLNTCLVVVNTRLQLFQHESVAQIKAAQSNLLPALNASGLAMHRFVDQAFSKQAESLVRIQESTIDVQNEVQQLASNITQAVTGDVHRAESKMAEILSAVRVQMEAYASNTSSLSETVITGNRKTETTLSEILMAVRDLPNMTWIQHTALRESTSADSNRFYPATAAQLAPKSTTVPLPDEGVYCGKFKDHNMDIDKIRSGSCINNIIANKNWDYGSTFTYGSFKSGGVGARVERVSKRYQRIWKAKATWWLNLFGPAVLEFEFVIQCRTMAWMSPSIQAAIRVVNVWPNDSPIFRATVGADLPKVKMLLESGEVGINDVNENGWSILSTAVIRPVWGSCPSPRYDVVRYLLASGSDPNIGSRPSLYVALDFGDIETARLLAQSGADIYHPSGPPDSYLPSKSLTVLKSGIELLQSQGFENWSRDSDGNPLAKNLLTAACDTGSPEMVMKALDDFCVEPSHLALRRAFQINAIEVVSILLHIGVKPGLRHGLLARTLAAPLITPSWQDSPHFILFCNENKISGYDPYYINNWRDFWGLSPRHVIMKTWGFQELEGLLAHLLFHDDFWLGSMFRITADWYLKYPGAIGIHDLVKIWSFYQHNGDDLQDSSDLLTRLYETECEKHEPRDIRWTHQGQIYKSRGMTINKELTIQRLELHEKAFFSWISSNEAEDWWYEINSNLVTPRRHLYEDPVHEDHRKGIPFDNNTLFYQTIATEQGRRHMSTYPMVVALCNALKIAGYRAEMCDDGYIWFDPDDGDRYYDAREYQPSPEDDTPGYDCPMCRNPDKYGLGHIIQRAEDGLNYMHEFRRRTREKKVAKEREREMQQKMQRERERQRTSRMRP